MLKRLLFVALMAFALLAEASVYSLPWGPKPQWVDANGAPMSSGTLTFYAAGTTTLQNTYTTQAGSVANSNPITLNSRGESPNEVWLSGGQTYKLILKDSTGSTVWTVDNLSGVNDPAATITEWVGGPTPTYVSANSFTLVGDQTTAFTPGRRLKFTITAGSAYGTIYTSAFATVTTVTMVMDSTGNLDSGLSSVSYGFQHSTNPSIPAVAQVTLVSAGTVNLASASGPSLHISGTTTITSFGTAPSGAIRTAVFDGALTLTHNGTSLILPGAANITTAAGDVGVFVSEGSGNWRCISYVGRNGVMNNATVAGTLGVTGAATLSSTLGVTGDVAVNTNKFNVTASTGNTTVAGTLAVTGNTTVTGSLTGASPIVATGTSLGSGSAIWFGSDTAGGGAINVPSAKNLLVLINQSEVARWNPSGYFKASNNGTYNSSTGTNHELYQTAADYALYVTNTNATGAGGISLKNTTDFNNASNDFLIGVGNATVRFEMRSNGGLANFSANNVNLSDATVKSGLRPAGSYWGFIKDLQVVDGWYTDDLQQRGAAARRHTMLTAQQVQTVEKSYGLDGPRSVIGEFSAGKLGVHEHSIEMRHLTVTQELQARVEHLEKRLAELEQRVAANDGMQYVKKPAKRAKPSVAANDAAYKQAVNR